MCQVYLSIFWLSVVCGWNTGEYIYCRRCDLKRFYGCWLQLLSSVEFSFRITQLNRCKNKSLSYGKQWIILLQNKPQHPPNHRARFGSSRPLCPAGSGICWLLIFHTMKTDSVRTTGKNTEASCSRHTPSCSEFTSDIHTVWDQIITRVKKHLIFYDKKFKYYSIFRFLTYMTKRCSKSFHLRSWNLMMSCIFFTIFTWKVCSTVFLSYLNKCR